MRKCIIVNSNDFKTKIEKAKTQKKTLVVQVAPAVRAAIGEPFGCVVILQPIKNVTLEK